MKEIIVRIENATGWHARPAAQVVRLAGRFKSQLCAQKGEKQADLKSLLDLLSLGICQNDQIILRAEGKDEEKALEKIAGLVAELNNQ